MPDSILIVDDAPINRKLTERVLAGAGYDVRSAEDAEAALAMMAAARPRMVLTDLRLQGSDGLPLVRRIKQDPRMRQTVVIALTACVAEDDRRRALDAGCDDYLVKPIDTRTFPDLIKAHLSRQQPSTGAAAAPAFVSAGPPAWLAEWSADFLRNGALLAQRLLAQAGSREHERDLREAAHVWAGLGQTLAQPEIAALARQVEELLGVAGPQRHRDLEAVLRRLATAFSRAPAGNGEAQAHPSLPPGLVQSVSGKKFVLDGLGSHDSARVLEVLEQAGAEVLDPDPEAFERCDLAIASADSGRLERYCRNSPAKPVLLVCGALTASAIDVLVEAADQEILAPPWTGEELLARVCRAFGKWSRLAARSGRARSRKASVLLADDDPTTLSLLKTTIESDGMDCAVAAEGDQALALIRRAPPDVAVLEAIMPNRDGFEVLAALRNDKDLKGVRVMLLTALQQESDIVRGFALGADDYVTKPFSPVEVLARIRRLLRSEP